MKNRARSYSTFDFAARDLMPAAARGASSLKSSPAAARFSASEAPDFPAVQLFVERAAMTLARWS